MTGAPAPVRLRRHRTLRALLAAEATSVLGSGLSTVAIPWLVLTRTHSPGDMGLVMGAGLCGTVLLGVLGASWAGRLGPRRVMLLGDCARGTLVALLAVLAAYDALSVPAAALVMFAMGGWLAPYAASQQALLPDLTGEDEKLLSRATAALQSAMRLGLMIGPPLGGLLVGVLGPARVVALDAATFAASALLIRRHLPVQTRPAALPGTDRLPARRRLSADGRVGDRPGGGRVPAGRDLAPEARAGERWPGAGWVLVRRWLSADGGAGERPGGGRIPGRRDLPPEPWGGERSPAGRFLIRRRLSARARDGERPGAGWVLVLRRLSAGGWAAEASGTGRGALTVGVRTLWADPLLATWSLALALSEFAWQGLFATIPVIALSRGHGMPAVAGLLSGGFAGGALLGTLLVGPLLRRLPAPVLAVTGRALLALSFFTLLLPLGVPALTASLAVAGLLNGVSSAPVAAVRALRVPAAVRAETLTVATTLALTGAAAGWLVSGSTVQGLGLHGVFLGLAAAQTAAALLHAVGLVAVRRRDPAESPAPAPIAPDPRGARP
ncbi:MFS transporter [Streptomyces sp. NPDC001606]